MADSGEVPGALALDGENLRDADHALGVQEAGVDLGEVDSEDANGVLVEENGRSGEEFLCFPHHVVDGDELLRCEHEPFVHRDREDLAVSRRCEDPRTFAVDV